MKLIYRFKRSQLKRRIWLILGAENPAMFRKTFIEISSVFASPLNKTACAHQPASSVDWLGASWRRTFTCLNCHTPSESTRKVFQLTSVEQAVRFVSVKRRSLKINPTSLQDKFRMEWPKITLFGDSITRRSMDPESGCWGSMIAHRVGSYFDVDPRGFEGYNSKWALELMPQLFPKSYLEKVEIFIPFFGHNDAWDRRFPAHVPVDQFEANTRAMVKYLTENGLGKEKIILITPTWYCEEEFNKYIVELGFPIVSKRFEEAEKYSDAILAIGKDLDLDVVDFFAVSARQEPLADMFCDGIHYSTKGAKLLFSLLMPAIEKKLEASWGKPIVDLWHAIPFDQHPEIKPVLLAHQQALKTENK